MSSSQSANPYDPADVIGQLIRILQDILAVLAEAHPGGILTTSILNLTCRRLETYRRPHVSTEAAVPALVALSLLTAARPTTRLRRFTRPPQRHPASSSRTPTCITAGASRTATPRIRGPCRAWLRRKTLPEPPFFPRPYHYDIETITPRKAANPGTMPAFAARRRCPIRLRRVSSTESPA
jgi:hypothetical protein